ncbi:SKP1-like protein 10 [Ditylenchus destructor]|uniref:SKP1-like protein 10 n=1 Tax=Ditylenchus destructor TaxID=166010 RepID=A0AAD4N2B5_9BILA|nr:SKP1-like protein 10 [Ditylenchus destructor]
MSSDAKPAPAETNESDTKAKRKIVQCRTGDGGLFEVPLNVISQAGTFAQMYSDLQLGAKSAAPFEFPMPAVSAKVFEELVEFCEQRIGVPEPVIEREPPTFCAKWFELNDFEKNFLEVKSVPELKELWMAARYLDIKSVCLFVPQEIATRLIPLVGDNKKVLEFLNEPDDLSEEEKSARSKKNIWLKYC